MFRSFVIVLLISPIALPQVRVSTSGTNYKAHQQIDVQITNVGKDAISYCVEFGQVSFKAGIGTVEDIEHTPMGFTCKSRTGNRAHC